MSEALGTALLIIARNTIALALEEACRAYEDAPRLSLPGATFVTLTRGRELRGCIGSLEATRALRTDVQDNAAAAAFRDPRFAPLTQLEFPDTVIEVSLLSQPEPLAADDEHHARSILRPGVDGVVLEFGSRRSTFLPQVWEQLPEPHQFLSHLKRKAGLQGDFWHGSIRLSRYTVQKWSELGTRSAAATP
ncbi:MAG: AmmeMemoRadiSam system protein A [Gammaproteobacteria bacterium]|nr:AmmeMemoRadiSam system protein A [Gammaproteobacteria bacterium]